MVRFDAYSATTEAAKATDLVQLVVDSVPGLPGSSWTVHQGKGFHTFGERIAFKGEDGGEFAAVMWGGQQGDRVMLEVKGERTPEAVERLRSRFPHRCTRVDACADFDAPGAFERLYRACREVKQDFRIVGGKAGDWEDFPERGRTLYIGATSSVTRVRLYEKGLQPEYLHLERPQWSRLEIQVRPTKDARDEFSSLSAVDVWGASRWTREIAGRLLAQHVDPHPAGSTYRQTSRQRALEWLCRQYGSHLIAEAEDLGGFDLLGRTLGEIIQRQRGQKKRFH